MNKQMERAQSGGGSRGLPIFTHPMVAATTAIKDWPEARDNGNSRMEGREVAAVRSVTFSHTPPVAVPNPLWPMGQHGSNDG